MFLVISHNSALKYWRLFSASGVYSQAALVRSHRYRRTLPPGSLLRLSEHLAIASPELTLAQVSSRYSMGQLIMAACEMCGTYLPTRSDSLPPERAPLTTTTQIIGLLEKMGYGREARAMQAARVAFNSAASPMEAKLALLLSLPQTMGGFGLPRPVLNAPIPLGPAAYRIYPCTPCRMDLHWAAANLDVEYDGRESHSEDRRDSDSARIVALTMEKVDVMVLRRQQVYDAKALASIAEVIAAKLGCRLRFSTRDFWQLHRRLREELGL